jgi:hypothetical protein
MFPLGGFCAAKTTFTLCKNTLHVIPQQLLRMCVAIAAYVHRNCCGIVITPFSPHEKPLLTSSLGGNHAPVSILQSFNINVVALTGRGIDYAQCVSQGAALGYM